MMHARTFKTIRWCLLWVLGASGVAGAQTILQVTNPLFPLTPVGQSVTKNVLLTVPNGGNSVVFDFILLAMPSADYSLGAITGCVVDGSTANVDGTTCVIPVTFTPTLPGSASSPSPIGRTAAIQVFDSENGNTQNFAVGVAGSGTMPRAIVVPGIISDLVGNDTTPTSGFAGDNGPASGAVFNNPSNMAVDSSGNLFISDTANCVVRRIDKMSGTVSTIAGVAPSPTPMCGPGNDAAGPLGSPLNGNTGIAVDFAGNIYIADTGNHAVRVVNPFLGTITTIAGQLNTPGYGGDGGPAIAASLSSPVGIAVDGNSNVFIADSGNFAVREISLITGNIQTIAGIPTQQGTPATETYGGPATSFLLGNPQQVTVDSAGNVYIADATTSGVLEVYAATQNVNLLFAVTGIPTSLAVDAADTLHATLSGQCGVYKLPVGTFHQLTIAGNGSCTPSGDGGSALAAGLNNPTGVVVDGTGSFYILENDGVRFVDSTGTNPIPIAFGPQQVLGVSDPLSVLLFNGDVATPAGTTPNPLGVYFYGNVTAPFAIVTPANSATDCSQATSSSSILLNPSAFCALAFTFTPQVDNSFTDGTNLFELAPSTGAQITQTINLSGTGTGTPATASLMPTSATLTAGIMGGIATQMFTLTNTGGGARLAVTSIAFTNTAVPGFSQTNTCTAPLASNATCTITVMYAPTQAGSVSQTLAVNDDATGTPQTISLTGTGVAPTASLTPSTLGFTGVVNETSQEQLFTLTNTSSSAYLVPGATYFPTGNGFTVNNQNSTCLSAVVAPGASCTVAVDFTPAVTGNTTNTLMLVDNTTGGMETATVNGTGTAPVASLSMTQLTFAGTVVGSQSAPQMVTLSNTGNAALNIQSITLAGNAPDSFQFSPGTCGTTLAAGASCTFQAAFAPQLPGAITAAILVTDDSGGQLSGRFVTQTVALNATAPVVVRQSFFGVYLPVFPSTPVGSSSTQSLQITLMSTSTVLKSIAMAPTFNEYIVGPITGCVIDGVTANPSGTVCTFNVSFSPTTVGSQHNSPLVVTTLEGGVPVSYFEPLVGSSTGQIAALTPGLINGVVASLAPPGVQAPYGLNGMGGPANLASVGFLSSFVLDAGQNLFVSDSYFGLIYKVTPDGLINIYAGTPPARAGANPPTLTGDQGPALSASLAVVGALALDNQNNLYVADSGASGDTELRVIDPATNIINKVLSSTNQPCSGASDSYGDGCPATQVAYNGATGMVYGPDFNLYYLTQFGIHVYNPQTGMVTLFAGAPGSTEGTGPDGGAAAGAAMQPSALTFDSAGNLLVVDNGVQVRRIAAGSGTISTIAGAPGSVLRSGGIGNLPCTSNGIDQPYHSSGNGGPATAAVFCQLTGISVDPANNIYVVDYSASEIRRIDSGTGLIHEVIGQNSIVGSDYGDQNGQYKRTYSASAVSLDYPFGVMVDGLGNVYELSAYGDVRKIDVSKSLLDFTPNSNFDFAPATPPATVPNPTLIGNVTGPLQVTMVNAGNAGPVSFNPPFTTPLAFGLSTANFNRDATAADCISTTAMLNPGQECAINLDFTPLVAGSPLTDVDTIIDTAGTQTIGVSGYATGQAPVTLTPALLGFGGAVGVTTAPQNFTLTNTMPGPIGIGSITLVGVNPGAFSISNNCGASLASNSLCQIAVTFTAPALGNFLAQASVVYTQPAGNGTYATTLLGGLVGTGGTPEGKFNADSVAGNQGVFGNQNVGITSAVHSLEFESTGTAPLLISAITLGGANANQFALASNNCPIAPAALAPGAYCTIGVTFTPTADSPGSPPTPFTAVLSAADNAPDTPQQQALSGTGVGSTPAVLAVLEAVHIMDAPLPQIAAALAVTESILTSDSPLTQQPALLAVIESVHVVDAPMTNIGGHAQLITFTQPVSPVATGTGPYNLQATASSSLPVTFSVLSGPGSISGAQLIITGAGTITVAADQAGGSGFMPAPEVQVTVTALALPAITPAPGGAAIPSGTTTPPFPVVVTFTAPGTLGSFSIGTLGAPGNAFALTSGGTCAIGTSYTSGQTCTAMITFTPTGPGVILGPLQALDNNGNAIANVFAASVRYR